MSLSARCAPVVVALLVSTVARAHVGSPDAWFEGAAGPYPIRVVVRVPGVVPGLAEIQVRVLDGDVTRVTASPFAWDAGDRGAPPPDVAAPVPGDPRLFGVHLWLMTAGSYGVHVTVAGVRGTGTAVVPVQAVATQRLGMDPQLAWILVALGLFLCAGLVTAIGAAVRDSTAPPGAAIGRDRTRRGRVVMAVSVLLLALALTGGRAWWNGVDRSYAAGLFKPLHSVVSVVDSAGGPWIRLTIDDPEWRGRRWTPLLADHGKLMHLFVARADDLGAIAHLHPVARDSVVFESRLPPLLSGRYRIYADIVHESGFEQTLTGAVDLPEPATVPASLRSDPDDSWFAGEPTPTASPSRASLRGGSTLIWRRDAEPIVAGRETPLDFEVIGPDGAPASLEPYLGMTAHAVVIRADGAVFAHLHPTGTASMAAALALTQRTSADSVRGSLGRRLSGGDGMAAMHAMGMNGMAAQGPDVGGRFSIPYGFPSPGRYRLWVQIKLAGRVETAAFDVEVTAPGT